MDTLGTIETIAHLDLSLSPRLEYFELRSANSGAWHLASLAVRIDRSPMNVGSEHRQYRDELWLLDSDFRFLRKVAESIREDGRVSEYRSFDISDDGSTLCYMEFDAAAWRSRAGAGEPGVPPEGPVPELT